MALNSKRSANGAKLFRERMDTCGQLYSKSHYVTFVYHQLAKYAAKTVNDVEPFENPNHEQMAEWFKMACLLVQSAILDMPDYGLPVCPCQTCKTSAEMEEYAADGEFSLFYDHGTPCEKIQRCLIVFYHRVQIWAESRGLNDENSCVCAICAVEPVEVRNLPVAVAHDVAHAVALQIAASRHFCACGICKLVIDEDEIIGQLSEGFKADSADTMDHTPSSDLVQDFGENPNDVCDSAAIGSDECFPPLSAASEDALVVNEEVETAPLAHVVDAAATATKPPGHNISEKFSVSDGSEIPETEEFHSIVDEVKLRNRSGPSVKELIVQVTTVKNASFGSVTESPNSSGSSSGTVATPQSGRSPSKQQRQQDYSIGDLVFAKIKGCTAWPARVIPMPDELTSGSSKAKPFAVLFFGTHEIGRTAAHDMWPYEANLTKFGKPKPASFRNGDFTRALWEIRTNPLVGRNDPKPSITVARAEQFATKAHKASLCEKVKVESVAVDNEQPAAPAETSSDTEKTGDNADDCDIILISDGREDGDLGDVEAMEVDEAQNHEGRNLLSSLSSICSTEF